MRAFVDREEELAHLNRLVQRPDGQFMIVYGRRRGGKPLLMSCLLIVALLSIIRFLMGHYRSTRLRGVSERAPVTSPIVRGLVGCLMSCISGG